MLTIYTPVRRVDQTVSALCLSAFSAKGVLSITCEVGGGVFGGEIMVSYPPIFQNAFFDYAASFLLLSAVVTGFAMVAAVESCD